eukprot:6492073-Amphidinium_carterae.2
MLLSPDDKLWANSMPSLVLFRLCAKWLWNALCCKLSAMHSRTCLSSWPPAPVPPSWWFSSLLMLYCPCQPRVSGRLQPYCSDGTSPDECQGSTSTSSVQYCKARSVPVQSAMKTNGLGRS